MRDFLPKSPISNIKSGLPFTITFDFFVILSAAKNLIHYYFLPKKIPLNNNVLKDRKA